MNGRKYIDGLALDCSISSALAILFLLGIHTLREPQNINVHCSMVKKSENDINE